MAEILVSDLCDDRQPWVLMMDKITTPEDILGQRAESAERARAAALADPILAAAMRKSEKPASL